MAMKSGSVDYVFCDIYIGHIHTSHYFGCVVPLNEFKRSMGLSDHIKPHLVLFFKSIHKANGFFIVVVRLRGQKFIFECVLRRGIVAELKAFV